VKIIYKTVKSINVISRLLSQNRRKTNNEHYYENSKVEIFTQSSSNRKCLQVRLI